MHLKLRRKRDFRTFLITISTEVGMKSCKRQEVPRNMDFEPPTTWEICPV